jgi:hypothetical protein
MTTFLVLYRSSASAAEMMKQMTPEQGKERLLQQVVHVRPSLRGIVVPMTVHFP